MFVTIDMGRADPKFVDPFKLCFEFDPYVVHVDRPLEQSPQETRPRVKGSGGINKRRRGRQWPSFGQVEVESNTKCGMSFRKANSMLGTRSVDHKSGRTHLGIVEGLDNPLGNQLGKPEVIGIHDDPPLHKMCLSHASLLS